jgi:hypothetical protein
VSTSADSISDTSVHFHPRVNELGKRGTLLFTGATASLRGNVVTSAFSSSKFALRALSQSLAKEFGKEDIHVCINIHSFCWEWFYSTLTFISQVAHAIIDGGILTDRSNREEDETKNLNPDSIAKVSNSFMSNMNY